MWGHPSEDSEMSSERNVGPHTFGVSWRQWPCFFGNTSTHIILGQYYATEDATKFGQKVKLTP